MLFGLCNGGHDKSVPTPTIAGRFEEDTNRVHGKVRLASIAGLSSAASRMFRVVVRRIVTHPVAVFIHPHLG